MQNHAPDAPVAPSGSEPGAPSEAPSAPAVPSLPLPAIEIGGPTGPEPTRYGDWERKGRCIDF
jgi:homeobox protein ESX1